MGWDIALIGLIGGLVTGLSPCILPVLPIVLAVSAYKRRKPWLVATGIGLSFTLVTLLDTLILNALGLPKDLLRWAGVVLAVSFAVGACTPLSSSRWRASRSVRGRISYVPAVRASLLVRVRW